MGGGVAAPPALGGISAGRFGAGLDPVDSNTGALLSFVIVFFKLAPAWIELRRAFLPTGAASVGVAGAGALEHVGGGFGARAGGGVGARAGARVGGGVGARAGACTGGGGCGEPRLGGLAVLLVLGGANANCFGVGLDPAPLSIGALLSFVIVFFKLVPA